MKQIIFGAVGASLLIAASGVVQAVVLNAGDVLTINAGTQLYDENNNPLDVPSGSWFGMDTNGNASISGTEKTPLAMGTTGLVIGATTVPGAYHSGCPVAGDTNAITAPWCFFGNTGSNYMWTAPTGDTVTGIDFSGWRWHWYAVNSATDAPLGSGAWGSGFSDGIASFVWSGVYGDTYTLDYTARFPSAEFSGSFGDVGYYLHLEGTVQAASAVPVPAAAWLFSSGLLGLVGIAKRK